MSYDSWKATDPRDAEPPDHEPMTVADELHEFCDREGIMTSHIYPPIPIRSFDWCAYRDPEVTPYGYGRTEAEAVADLLSNEEA